MSCLQTRVATFLFFMLTAVGQAADLTSADLVKTLKAGGNTLVMRHANAPQTPPDASTADKANIKRERQLDEAGKAESKAIGDALRQLQIRISEVVSSPTFRAQETVRYAGLPSPTLAAELDESAQGMAANSASGSTWIKQKAGKVVAEPGNVLLVTHTPNIVGAFGEAARGMAAGEILVVRGDATGAPKIVGRIKPSEWASLVKEK